VTLTTGIIEIVRITLDFLRQACQTQTALRAANEAKTAERAAKFEKKS